MTRRKSGKELRNDFKKYGVFANEDLHGATHEYREILVRSAERTGNTYFLDKFDECWDRWRNDHGN
jgi:hypothetical protein